MAASIKVSPRPKLSTISEIGGVEKVTMFSMAPTDTSESLSFISFAILGDS